MLANQSPPTVIKSQPVGGALSAKRNRRVADMLVVVILSLLSLITIIPFIWMISTSLDWEAVAGIPFPPRLWPGEATIDTYRIAFTNVPLLRYVLNSFIIAGGVLLIAITSAMASGYALSKINFRGSNFILVLALSTMMIPFESTMIPMYRLFDRLGLINSYWAFYLPAITFGFGTFLAKQFMDQLPGSLREAAVVDGASEWRVFVQIFLPLCGPIIATMVILHFLAIWNDFLWPLLVIHDADKYTLQLGMAMFSYNKGENQFVAILMAATTISIAPILALYLFLQKYIIESIALTGLKQ